MFSELDTDALVEVVDQMHALSNASMSMLLKALEGRWRLVDGDVVADAARHD